MRVTVRVESGGAEHSVNIHKSAASLEVRHHGRSLKHTKESFCEVFSLTCVKVLEYDLLRAGVLVGLVIQVD